MLSCVAGNSVEVDYFNWIWAYEWKQMADFLIKTFQLTDLDSESKDKSRWTLLNEIAAWNIFGFHFWWVFVVSRCALRWVTVRDRRKQTSRQADYAAVLSPKLKIQEKVAFKKVISLNGTDETFIREHFGSCSDIRKGCRHFPCCFSVWAVWVSCAENSFTKCGFQQNQGELNDQINDGKIRSLYKGSCSS